MIGAVYRIQVPLIPVQLHGVQVPRVDPRLGVQKDELKLSNGERVVHRGTSCSGDGLRHRHTQTCLIRGEVPIQLVVPRGRHVRDNRGEWLDLVHEQVPMLHIRICVTHVSIMNDEVDLSVGYIRCHAGNRVVGEGSVPHVRNLKDSQRTGGDSNHFGKGGERNILRPSETIATHTVRVGGIRGKLRHHSRVDHTNPTTSCVRPRGFQSRRHVSLSLVPPLHHRPLRLIECNPRDSNLTEVLGVVEVDVDFLRKTHRLAARLTAHLDNVRTER
mmetsp:Transcript_30367/g.35059  ORF Transcript_30367/g.35059 Transcript_30367/m.35059 type:complete len:273 (-) Transcript_30367:523-1341(-)